MSANTIYNYYDVLGVSMNASQDDVKRAYREAVLKNNPRKGGDLEKCKALCRAYKILSDPEKREIYDQYGPPRLLKDVVYPLVVSLEDLFNGTSITRKFSSSVVCSKCNGKGSKSGASSMQCSGCGGSGKKLLVRHPGPPPMRFPQPCNECRATGEIISETINDEDLCEQCKGEQVVKMKRVVEVHVEKGMQNGQKIPIPKATTDTVRGGIVYILQQEEHPKFKRKGDDLHVEHSLSLKESLSGFQFVLAHLDNRQLTIKSQPGEIVKSGQVKEINGEGMPMYQRPSSMRGKLYIHFTVEYPDSLTPNQSKAIKAVLSPRSSPELTDKEVVNEGVEKTTLHDEEETAKMTLHYEEETGKMTLHDEEGTATSPMWMVEA